MNTPTEKPRTIEEERAGLARLLGMKVEQIRELQPQWQKLLRESVVVRLHIGRTRAVKRMRLSDLGLTVPGDPNDSEELNETVFVLGEKMLLPPDLLRCVTAAESRARRNLVLNSMESYWGRLVPVTAYQKWKERDLAIQKDYFSVRDELCKDYRAVVRRMRELYTPAAETAFERLARLERKVNLPPKPEFVKRFVQAAVDMMPEEDDIYASWTYEVEMFHVPLPSLLAEDLAEKQKIEAETQRQVAQLTQERSRIENKTYLAQARARRKEQALLSATERRRKALEEMNRDVVEKARKRKETEVDRFFADLMRQIYDLTYRSAAGILQSIEKGGGKTGPRSIVALRRLVEQIDALNFLGNEDITAMLAPVREQIQRTAENRSGGDIASTLRDIAIVTRSSLLTLGQTPRSARSLGVADQPGEAVVRAAREGLGMDAAPGGTGRKMRQLGLADTSKSKEPPKE